MDKNIMALNDCIQLMIQRIQSKCCIDKNEYYDKIMCGILKEIYLAGRSHQAKLDRDAVHELFLKPDMVDFGADEVEVIAALAAAAIVEKP